MHMEYERILKLKLRAGWTLYLCIDVISIQQEMMICSVARVEDMTPVLFAKQMDEGKQSSGCSILRHLGPLCAFNINSVQLGD